MQFILAGQRDQLVIGDAAPKKERQTRRQLQVTDPPRTAYGNARRLGFLAEHKFRVGEDADNYAMQQLGVAMARGQSSRFYQHLVKEKQLASNVSIATDARIGTSQMYISATPRAGVSLADLEKGVDDEIEAVVKEGITADELAKAKTQILRRFIDRRRTVLGTAQLIGEYAVKFAEPELINTIVDQRELGDPRAGESRRQSLCAPGPTHSCDHRAGASAKGNDSGVEMMRTVAIVALMLTALAASTVRSQEKTTPLSNVERLKRAPVSKELLDVRLPRPIVAKLPNGLTLLILEDHKLPTVTFTLWIRPGQLADPSDLPGLASFTADMLREGTERRSSLDIAAEADWLGATLGANARFGASYTAVNAAGFSDSAAQLLDLLSDIILHPAFAPAELVSYKQRQMAALEQRLANPVFLGQRAFRQVLYGDGPLGMASPTRDSIRRVTAEDLKHFHDQHYRPGNTILGATGDFKAGDLRVLIEKYFAAWSGSAEPPLSFAERTEPQSARITLVDRPGSVQTYIIGGSRGIRRTDPAYYSLQVMNQVLGGGPQARLFLDLREEHGYTYGAYSNFSAEIYPGEWLAAAAVRTPVTDGSMTRFVYQFKRISSEPVPQSELDDARHAIVANFALSLEQPARLLDDWMTVQHYGLPADYWDQYADRIAEVDAAAVQARSRKFVDLTHMQWVCVGDRRQVWEVLSKYGPVIVVDADGRSEN